MPTYYPDKVVKIGNILWAIDVKTAPPYPTYADEIAAEYREDPSYSSDPRYGDNAAEPDNQEED